MKPNGLQRILGGLAFIMGIRLLLTIFELLYACLISSHLWLFDFSNSSLAYWYNTLSFFTPFFVYLWGKSAKLPSLMTSIIGTIAVVQIGAVAICVPFAQSLKKTDEEVTIHQVQIGKRLVKVTRRGLSDYVCVTEEDPMASIFIARKILGGIHNCKSVKICPVDNDTVTLYFASTDYLGHETTMSYRL